jgi:hypothetical protein
MNKITYINGAKTTYAYDSSGRGTSIVAKHERKKHNESRLWYKLTNYPYKN